MIEQEDPNDLDIELAKLKTKDQQYSLIETKHA